MPYIDSDGVQLYAEETGTGTPVVFVHEFAADYRAWEAQVRRFSRDYRCITYNARGYPPSGVPSDGGAYGYERHREDLRAILDGFGIDAAHIVGLSMGAYAGLQFALRYPGRVRSLLFASGGSGSTRTGAERDAYAARARADAGRMLRDGMEAGADTYTLGPARTQLLAKDPRGWAEFKTRLAEHSALGSSLTLRNYQARRPSLFDSEAELRDLDVPVLLAVGDEDDAVIEVNLFLKRVLPRAGLWISPNTGHPVNLEEPDSFNAEAARFLAAAERGRWGPRRG
ncbi:MAG: alpha/beta hydrolase [Actinomycetia bacterium]|nr:alpha/beta hydrolase [Actinomycetes bacterium]